ncbi:semaphorin-5A-like [Gigantopelta aegis]|uniref:semaphorin-5A-like n=1 Tax=Gigantopelta aegis TaxID=1735272 RepID=UPI001B88C76C|nr:semaphorin-5A-like [Gigantopelta aegis]
MAVYSTMWIWISILVTTEGISTFVNPNLIGHVQIAVDMDRDQLLVGARNSIFRLSLSDLRVIQTAEWNADSAKTKLCVRKGFSKELCHNFIRVLFVFKDKVLACGTNAFDPLCSWRSANDIQVVRGSFSGQAICPFNPEDEVSSVMSHDGSLFASAATDSRSLYPLISRKLGPFKPLWTAYNNQVWVNYDADFVSAYDIGEFVYFFFRETAAEFAAYLKIKYSRVARMCKNDKGGSVILEENWTTFLKARMICTLPGDFPFYLDEIQDTYYSETKQLIYAIFSTPPNSISGSAVCVYNMSSLQKAFTGPFRHRQGPGAWIQRENTYPVKTCSKAGTGISMDELQQAGMNQLMYSSLEPVDTHPLLFAENLRWTHLAVDDVAGKHGAYSVLFLVTEKGRLRKMLVTNHMACFIEEIKIEANGNSTRVDTFKLSREKGAIFLSTLSKIFKIPVARCERFANKSACIESNDPYCGWNTKTGKCSQAPRGQTDADHWHQPVRSCSILQYVDDDSVKWSEWSMCQLAGKSNLKCLCRHRNCVETKGYHGNRCSGHVGCAERLSQKSRLWSTVGVIVTSVVGTVVFSLIVATVVLYRLKKKGTSHDKNIIHNSSRPNTMGNTTEQHDNPAYQHD